MSKIQIIGTHCYLDATLITLQKLGAVQLEDAATGVQGLTRLPRDLSAEGQRETLSYTLVRLDSLLAALPLETPPARRPDDASQASRAFELVVAETRAGLETLATSVQTLTQRRNALVAERQSLPRYEATIRRLMPLASEIPRLSLFETVALLIDRHFEHVLENMQDELGKLTEQQIEIVSGTVDEQTLGAVLVFPKEYSPAIHDFLGREQINQLRLPEELVDVPLHQTLSALQARMALIPAELAETDAKLAALATEWHGKLAVRRALVRDRMEVLQARTLLAATHSTFIVSGWIPQRAIPDLQRALQDAIGDEIVVVEAPISQVEWENAPVVLQNPAIVQPFETLIRLLALPRYSAIDPSALMAFFMPLFFGMILGDIAYGVAVLGVGFWLQRRFYGTLQDLGKVFLLGGVWSIVFGFVFGEFLGSFGEKLGLHPLWLNRADALIPLFVTAVAVGLFQVILGLILGAWVAIRQRHLGRLSEKVGALISLIGLSALIAVVAELLPTQFFTPLLVVVLVGVVLLSVPMGLIGVLLGPLELLGTIGNVLSYLRIAAIGLSSVYLAEVANEMAGLLGNIVLGSLVAGLLHILNTALGIVSPTIQALRLQYVEFFGKFFEGGGKPFRPFKREGFVGWQG